MSILFQTVRTDLDIDGIPVDRLYRLSSEQFRVASEAGVFPASDDVKLVEGLLRSGPNGPLYRLNLDQFHRMYGVPDLERVELLGGWLVARMPILPPHRTATYNTRVELERLAPLGTYYVDQGAPSSKPRTDTEPLPDIQVIRGRSRDYRDRHPRPEDVALLVEISDSTISIDRNYKLRLYAREGIAVYWIVNLTAMRLEVYTDPSGAGGAASYLRNQHYGPEDEVPLVLDGVVVGRIAVRDLLPWAPKEAPR